METNTTPNGKGTEIMINIGTDMYSYFNNTATKSYGCLVGQVGNNWYCGKISTDSTCPLVGVFTTRQDALMHARSTWYNNIETIAECEAKLLRLIEADDDYMELIESPGSLQQHYITAMQNLVTNGLVQVYTGYRLA